MYKDFKKIIAGLKYWKLSIEDPSVIQNFQSRMVLQKLAYICKVLGIAVNYPFNFYVHGPYSPQLADDYYQYSDKLLQGSIYYIPNDSEINAFNKIRKNILSQPMFQKYRTEMFEAIATILFFKEANSELTN